MRLMLITFLIASCAPEPFVVGEATEPPFGCVEARRRGVDC